MIWIGNSVSAHRKKGHHPQPRWEYKNGVKVIKRWVCTCGATLRG